MLKEQIAQWGEASFGQPAPETELKRCEEALGEPLPPELRTLLKEADGVVGEYGLGLVWESGRIAHDNRHFRSDSTFGELYLPFEGLVFFADAGNGDQFAIALRANREVYVWDHEDDSRRWVAPTVMVYLEWWMTGRLSI